jgi:hypothetical protein
MQYDSLDSRVALYTSHQRLVNMTEVEVRQRLARNEQLQAILAQVDTNIDIAVISLP